MKPNLLGSGLLLGALLASPSFAASDAEVAELKKMLEGLKQDYETRIKALENKLAEAESKSAAQASQPAQYTPPTASISQSNNAFNPAISVTLQGTAANYSRDPDSWNLPGFQTGGEAGLLTEGMSLMESELTASANVDNLFYGQFTLGLHEEDGSTHVDVEEAFIDTLSLPAGLGLRFGRFFAETGYINTHHSHTWDFVDAPLTSQAFLGKQYKDDGLRLSWIAPINQYLELGLESLRGQNFPASGEGDQFLGGAQNMFARFGGDVGDSNSYQVGASYLMTEPVDRSGGHAHAHDHEADSGETHGAFFSGDSDLAVLDLVWKWAPGGHMQNQNLVLQAELFSRNEDGFVNQLEGDEGALFAYDGKQWGYYTQAIYQFMPQWRAGLRYDRLGNDNQLSILENSTDESADDLAGETGLVSDYEPSRLSAMLDWTPSEFSRVRLQYSRDKSTQEADDQFFLQYIMSFGAHGAHQY